MFAHDSYVKINQVLIINYGKNGYSTKGLRLLYKFRSLFCDTRSCKCRLREHTSGDEK